MNEFELAMTVMSLAIVSGTSIVLAAMFLRRRPRASEKAVSSAAEQRLERIEQAVEVMAIEVERIAEGQRFLNNVMAGREGDRVPLSPAPRAERGA